MVTVLDVQKREVVLGGKPFGAAGAYEKIAGTIQRWDWIHASSVSASGTLIRTIPATLRDASTPGLPLI